MTRKDYKTLAACIGLAFAEGWSVKKERKELEAWQQGVISVSDRIAMELELDNPRFSRDRFRDEITNAIQERL